MSEQYLVVGLGQTGLSVARFLARHQQPFVAYDTRKTLANIDAIEKEFPSLQMTLGDTTDIDWQQITTVVVSPGIASDEAVLVSALQHNLPIIGDIELFARHNKQPVIGITGTNGKSSVTQMVGDILSASGKNVAVCGNIGKPVLDVIDDEYDVFVIELSSFQLEATQSLHIDVACILNMSPDHLDRHKTFDNYKQAKHRIFLHAQNIVVNVDDENTKPLRDDLQTYGFGLSNQADFHLSEDKLMYQSQKLLSIADLTIVGTHNMLNALAAAAITYAFGLSLESIVTGLKTFRGLAHRCQWVKESQGVTWINDSKGTNVGATIAAMKGLGNETHKNIIWIAGGQGKGADFSELADYTARYIKKAVLFGEDKALIAASLPTSVTSKQVASLEEAISMSMEAAKPGDIVLFSPACASFDMFKNFVERGESFMRLVLAI